MRPNSLPSSTLLRPLDFQGFEVADQWPSPGQPKTRTHTRRSESADTAKRRLAGIPRQVPVPGKSLVLSRYHSLFLVDVN